MQVWKPKQQLQNGKFTIQKVLGGGGYGVTYSAIDKNTNKIVAIKTLNPIHQSRADFEQMHVKFVQEAFRLVQCSHSHIVKVHEVINEGGLWGMVMEYVRGQDLAIYINQRGKLPEEKALKYINQVGTALEYIHKQGLLHRDVKPNNVMLRQSQEEVVLIDFGLAREFSLHQTGSMTNAITEGYAPIEQYERRGKFGAYTDVYALAATLYALVTGDIPLPAKFRNTGIPLPLPKQRNPEISDRVNDGIIKGMELEPDNRPQTVSKWLELVMPVQSKLNINVEKRQLPTTVLNPRLPETKPAKIPQVSKIHQNKPPTPQRISQVSEKNGFGNIQTRKFEFTYAKVDQNFKVNYYRGQAEGFTEDLGNGVTLDMMAISGGNFIMGAPENERGGKHFERPQHQVNVQTFFMGKYQVTQENYQVIMGKNPSHIKGKKQPVQRVNWYDAVEFCNKLSKLTGKKYRLPSEVEWEYACRSGTTTPFNFGDTITTDLANYYGNSTYGAAPKGVYRGQTTDVGTFPANFYGLYDMHGNVWEWCLDDGHENYNGAPIDGSAWMVKNNNLYQVKGCAVLRGGSWTNAPKNCRSAFRHIVNRAECNSINDDIGFRVVCTFGRDS